MNSEVELDLSWIKDCVLVQRNNITRVNFMITSTKPCVPVVTLSLKDSNKFLEHLKPWYSGYHYYTTSFNKAWTQVMRRFCAFYWSTVPQKQFIMKQGFKRTISWKKCKFEQHNPKTTVWIIWLMQHFGMLIECFFNCSKLVMMKVGNNESWQ